METNPNENAERRVTQTQNYSFLQTGLVTGVADDQTSGRHHIQVQETRTPIADRVPYIPPAHGDYYLPTEGTTVVLFPRGQNRFFAMGSPVPKGATPSISPGERVVSHPLSKAAVHFNTDGTLNIYGDTTVRINGGTQGIVSDVQAADRNSNNGITALDIIRNNNIKI